MANRFENSKYNKHNAAPRNSGGSSATPEERSFRPGGQINATYRSSRFSTTEFGDNSGCISQQTQNTNANKNIRKISNNSNINNRFVSDGDDDETNYNVVDGQCYYNNNNNNNRYRNNRNYNNFRGKSQQQQHQASPRSRQHQICNSSSRIYDNNHSNMPSASYSNKRKGGNKQQQQPDRASQSPKKTVFRTSAPEFVPRSIAAAAAAAVDSAEYGNGGSHASYDAQREHESTNNGADSYYDPYHATSSQTQQQFEQIPAAAQNQYEQHQRQQSPQFFYNNTNGNFVYAEQHEEQAVNGEQNLNASGTGDFHAAHSVMPTAVQTLSPTQMPHYSNGGGGGFSINPYTSQVQFSSATNSTTNGVQQPTFVFTDPMTGISKPVILVPRNGGNVLLPEHFSALSQMPSSAQFADTSCGTSPPPVDHFNQNLSFEQNGNEMFDSSYAARQHVASDAEYMHNKALMHQGRQSAVSAGDSSSVFLPANYSNGVLSHTLPPPPPALPLMPTSMSFMPPTDNRVAQVPFVGSSNGTRDASVVRSSSSRASNGSSSVASSAGTAASSVFTTRPYENDDYGSKTANSSGIGSAAAVAAASGVDSTCCIVDDPLFNYGTVPGTTLIDGLQYKRVPNLHPLYTPWTLWYVYGTVTERIGWENALVRVAGFGTVEGCWQIIHHVVPPSWLAYKCMYALFRGAEMYDMGMKPDKDYVPQRWKEQRLVMPEWEDKANAPGGRWQMRLPSTSTTGGVDASDGTMNENHARTTGLVDTIWREAIMIVVGEQLGEFSRFVTGIFVQQRKQQFRLEIWLNTSDEQICNQTIIVFCQLIEAVWRQQLTTTTTQAGGGHIPPITATFLKHQTNQMINCIKYCMGQQTGASVVHTFGKTTTLPTPINQRDAGSDLLVSPPLPSSSSTMDVLYVDAAANDVRVHAAENERKQISNRRSSSTVYYPNAHNNLYYAGGAADLSMQSPQLDAFAAAGFQVPSDVVGSKFDAKSAVPKPPVYRQRQPVWYPPPKTSTVSSSSSMTNMTPTTVSSNNAMLMLQQQLVMMMTASASAAPTAAAIEDQQQQQSFGTGQSGDNAADQ